jgi:hypothetical protein
MKVFITRPDKVEVTVDLKKPSLPDFLRADREAVRCSFNKLFGEMFKTFGEMFKTFLLSVRFEDECPECRGVMDDGGYTYESGRVACHNPCCQDGRPPRNILHLLMAEMPPLDGGKERASDWYDRMEEAWRMRYAK